MAEIENKENKHVTDSLNSNYKKDVTQELDVLFENALNDEDNKQEEKPLSQYVSECSDFEREFIYEIDLTDPHNEKARNDFLDRIIKCKTEKLEELKPCPEPLETKVQQYESQKTEETKADYAPNVQLKQKVKKIKKQKKQPAEAPQSCQPNELKKPVRKPITIKQYYERHPELMEKLQQKRLEKMLDYSAYKKPEEQKPEPQPFYKRAFNAIKGIYNRIFG